MKRDLSYLLAGFALFAVVLAAFLLALYGRGLGSDRWTYLASARKETLARAVDDPKIVLLGGSNLLFGLRSPEIAKATGRPTINMGVRAGLGLSYMLHRIRPVLKPGDTLILVVEESLWGSQEPLNGLVATLSFAQGDGYWRALSALDRVRYLLFAASPDNVRQMFVADANQEPYHIGNLDEFGDDLSNIPTPATRGIIAALATKPAPPPELPREADRALGEFLAWARQSGVQVLATWPNQMSRPISDPADWAAHEVGLVRHLASMGVAMIGRREEAVLPPELMFDSEFHPSAAGRDIRTRRFVAALCASTDLCRR